MQVEDSSHVDRREKRGRQWFYLERERKPQTDLDLKTLVSADLSKAIIKKGLAEMLLQTQSKLIHSSHRRFFVVCCCFLFTVVATE